MDLFSGWLAAQRLDAAFDILAQYPAIHVTPSRVEEDVAQFWKLYSRED